MGDIFKLRTAGGAGLFILAILSLAALSSSIPHPSYAQGKADEYYRSMDARISGAPPEARECTKAEREKYESAVNWFPRIRDKGSFPKYSCQPMHSAQESPPKPCCDTYYATRNKPGMWDESWYVLQECGWREEIKKRKEAFYKQAETCLQRYPAVKQQAPDTGTTTLYSRVKRAIEGYPNLQKAINSITGKNAFIVSVDEKGSIYVINNRGQRVLLPASLAGKFGVSKQFAVIFNNDFLAKALPGNLVASSEHGSIRGTINGGGDFVYLQKQLKDLLYIIFNDNRIDMNTLATSMMIASSEHGSIKGTINGGGDFIDEPLPPPDTLGKGPAGNLLLAYRNQVDGPVISDVPNGPAIYAALPARNYVFVITPSAQMTIAGKAVVDVGHNGVTGVLVLEGKTKVREGTSAAEREIQAGSAVVIVPGYGVGNPVSTKGIRINPWWEGTARQEHVQDWAGALSKGHQVSVILDAVTDSGESSRYLGTIKAGETYIVRYIPSSGQWQATGYNKGTKATGTWTYPGGKPGNYEFNIWGRIFRFDGDGRVFDSQLGHVGRLLPPKNTGR